MSSTRLYVFISLLTSLHVGRQVHAQQFVFLDSIPVVGDNIVVDKMGFMYGVGTDYIVKYNSSGDSLFYFSNKLLGEIDQLEVSIALRPLLFYKNSNQIIVTDNTLSAQLNQSIALEQLDWQQVTRIASRFNNNKIWLYDQSNFELLLISHQLQIEQRSGNLLQLIGLDTLDVLQVKEYQNKVYINNPKSGIHVFDLFGTYYNTIHLKNLADFELYNNHIVSFKNDSIGFYNMLSFQENKFPLPIKDFGAITLKNDLLYILKSGIIFRYKTIE